MYKVEKYNEGDCHYCDDVAFSRLIKDGEEVKCGGCDEPVVMCEDHTRMWEAATSLQQNEVLSGKLTHGRAGDMHIHIVQIGGDRKLEEKDLPQPVKEAIEVMKLLHELRKKGYPDLADGLQQIMVKKAAEVGIEIQLEERLPDPLSSFDVTGAIKQ